MDENEIDIEISKNNIEENFKIMDDLKKELDLIRRAEKLVNEEENK